MAPISGNEILPLPSISNSPDNCSSRKTTTSTLIAGRKRLCLHTGEDRGRACAGGEYGYRRCRADESVGRGMRRRSAARERRRGQQCKCEDKIPKKFGRGGRHKQVSRSCRWRSPRPSTGPPRGGPPTTGQCCAHAFTKQLTHGVQLTSYCGLHWTPTAAVAIAWDRGQILFADYDQLPAGPPELTVAQSLRGRGRKAGWSQYAPVSILIRLGRNSTAGTGVCP